MAGGINIPGVSDRYKTNDLVEALMEVERQPLKREQENLQNYKNQQDAWREVNTKMSALRTSVKTLYSFENPFVNKLCTSSDEDALTVEASRDASYGSFKIDVVETATSDRFLSKTLEKDTNVAAGKYTFTVGEKTIDFNWKGGKLEDFVTAINKRGDNTIKASLINISSSKKSLLIESLKTGEENKLIFKNDALSFAKDIQMIQPSKNETTKLDISFNKLKNTTTESQYKQQYLSDLTKNNVTSENNQIIVKSRGGFEIDIPKGKNDYLDFVFETKDAADISSGVDSESKLQLPNPGGINFKGINVFNNSSETLIKDNENTAPISIDPIEVEDNNIFFIKTKNGQYLPISDLYFTKTEDGKTQVSVNLSNFDNPTALVVKNYNTGKEIILSNPEVYENKTDLGYTPTNPVSVAHDAKIKYEGITVTRGTNDIDDVIPNITLHLHDVSEKTVNVKVESDPEAAKDAIITFVGKYNQVLAEINILSQNKPEVIAELDYLTPDEIEAYREKLGMFQSDFTLSNGRQSLQEIVSTIYRYSESADIYMLSQLGISTNSGGNTGGGYNAAQMRGYLEIDEKKLDEVLKNNMADIKNMFGYDSDGDLIIDEGIGYKMDKLLTSWVQSGGIISNKTAALESNIKATDKKISRLEDQLEQKEADLKRKYAMMEGSLNSLESQSNSIQNSLNQNKQQ